MQPKNGHSVNGHSVKLEEGLELGTTQYQAALQAAQQAAQNGVIKSAVKDAASELAQGMVKAARQELSYSDRAAIVSGRGAHGWRAGKPEEDPQKTKRWGVVTARPSEFLIHMRGGKVVSSGQGASCWKWPWDSVAVVPTTVQRLQFSADQITSEKVGVRVIGLAVYRIADPMLAFRMLNFSFPERAQQKLEELLEEMFEGAVRRLVANLTVDACLTRRKDGIASELMREIAPVVAGSGRAEDRTQRGWGVVIDTIEIQDVRVLSSTVFSHLQARYKNEQERNAREAELGKERAVRQQKAEAERQIALAEVASEAEVSERRREAKEHAELEALAMKARIDRAKLDHDAQAKQAALEAQQRAELETLAMKTRLDQAKLESQARAKQAALEAERQAELEAVAIRTELEQAKLASQAAANEAVLAAEQRKKQLAHQGWLMESANRLEAAQQELELVRHKQQIAQAELEMKKLELERHRLEQQLEVEHKQALRQIENTVSPEVVSLTVAQQLPQLAAAFQQNMGEVHVTSVDGANPFGYIAAAVEGVMGLARSAGLELPKRPSAPPPQG